MPNLTRKAPESNNAVYSDSDRLDFLVQQLAIVHHGGRGKLTAAMPDARGYWVEWFFEDIQQPNVYDTAGEAIDAAITAQRIGITG